MLALLLFVQIACIEGGDDIKYPWPSSITRRFRSLVGVEGTQYNVMLELVEDLAEYESWKRKSLVR